MKVRCGRKLLLTGTPLQNNLVGFTVLVLQLASILSQVELMSHIISVGADFSYFLSFLRWSLGLILSQVVDVSYYLR